jgi:uncharacterized protein YjiK
MRETAYGPDGKTLYVNIQNPSTIVAMTGQGDDMRNRGPHPDHVYQV